MRPIHRVLVLGGGSAGFLAAITLKTKLRDLPVVVLRSPEIGIIGVGEGTTNYVPEHLHGYLNISLADFYREARPSWKLGIRFVWGPRPFFNYTFTFQVNKSYPGLRRLAGYYVDDDFSAADLASAVMTADRAFTRQPNGAPVIPRQLGYHLENETLVAFLEKHAQTLGVEIREGKVVDVIQDDHGIRELVLESGERLQADLFVDASGFRSELLGKALREPFTPFRSTLFCDRAVVGGWARADEPILPYTMAETMESGWCWQIEHEGRINRGYVYSSSFISDADAEAEFRRKCPKVRQARIVKFIAGRYERSWVKNVVGVGNASGFVEPLESTSLYVICAEAQALVETLAAADRAPGPACARQFNHYIGTLWDVIRRFLAVHYRFNTRLDTPFWKACRADVDLAGAEEIVDYFQENGPDTLWSPTLMTPLDPFKLEGYYTLLLGQKVPFQRRQPITEQELAAWSDITNAFRFEAERSLTVAEALSAVHSPYWRWDPDFYRLS